MTCERTIFRNADAVFYLLFPFDIGEAVAVRRRPSGRSDGKPQTRSDDQSRASF